MTAGTMVTKGVKADVKTDDVVATLGEVTAARGMDALTARLEALQSLLAGDLAEVEEALGVVGLEGDTPAHRSARHLLALGGKRLRPICVALAAHVGTGFNEAAKTFAVAVEMIHNATLLHDDVVDLGDRRRGADTARVVYGNAASIFGGDFLLADALCRVQAAGVDGVLPHMLKTVKELVTAETLQLAARGKVRSSTSDYFRIAQGKTASLFRWAMFAGARAGGVGLRECEALEAYGGMLGLAFQIVDDVLDYAGDPDATGKDLLTDLREGKMTYPLLLAVERDPGLAVALEANCRGDEVSVTPEIARRIGRVMSEGGVVPECLTLATRMCRDAAKSLEILPSSPARSALEDVALATPLRRK